MKCGVYLNGYGFKVGRKYLSFVKAYSGRVVARIPLTCVDTYLASIKEMYTATDIRRTREVIALFGEDD